MDYSAMLMDYLNDKFGARIEELRMKFIYGNHGPEDEFKYEPVCLQLRSRMREETIGAVNAWKMIGVIGDEDAESIKKEVREYIRNWFDVQD